MIPAERLQNWAEYLSPPDLGLAVLVIGCAIALITGVLRAPRQLPAALPLLAYLIAAAATIREWSSLPVPARVGLALTTLAALAVHLRVSGRSRAAESDEPPPVSYESAIEDPFRPADAVAPERSATPLGLRLVLLVGAVLGTVLLFDDLRDYAATVLAWESSVVQHGFAPLLAEEVSPLTFAEQCLRWDDGVLSAGQSALFFGPPTLAFFGWSISPVTLRLASVIATLLAVPALFVFVRRHYGLAAGAAAAVFAAVNTPVLYYGRYGSSLAGTLLAVVLAFAATWRFLDRGRWVLFRAVVCGVLLFLATVQYATARLAVLFLLGWIPLVLITHWRRTRWSHWLGLVLIGAMAWGVWSYQADHETTRFFLHGRGEQVFGLIKHPETIAPLVGTEERFTRLGMDDAKKLEVVKILVGKTLEELGDWLAADPEPRVRGAVVRWDPPPMAMYFAPLGAFALLGLAWSVRHWRSWKALGPVLFAVSYCAALMLTNRIDAHRGFLLLLPFSIWLGVGVREIAWAADRTRVPAFVLTALALTMTLAAAYGDVWIRYRTHYRIGPADLALAEEIRSIPGPVRFWMARDHRILSWLELAVLDKARVNDEEYGGVLPQALHNGLRADKGGPRRLAVREASHLAKHSTMLLGPRVNFSEAARQMQRRGLRVVEREAAGFEFYRIDGGERFTGIPDSELPPLPPIPRPATPAPVRLSKGPKVYLSDLQARSIDFGFRAPRMDAAWHGGPITMAGLEYDKGIGTHAWTELTYEVPQGAQYLQAVVGLSDVMRTCEKASIRFEVRGSRGGTLWKSGLIDFASPPVPLQVPVGNQSEVTLVSLEASDGRDCDHANWADVAFVLRRAPARKGAAAR